MVAWWSGLPPGQCKCLRDYNVVATSSDSASSFVDEGLQEKVVRATLQEKRYRNTESGQEHSREDERGCSEDF